MASRSTVCPATSAPSTQPARANPLAMLWPEMDAALVTSGGGGPPQIMPRRPVSLSLLVDLHPHRVPRWVVAKSRRGLPKAFMFGQGAACSGMARRLVRTRAFALRRYGEHSQGMSGELTLVRGLSASFLPARTPFSGSKFRHSSC